MLVRLLYASRAATPLVAATLDAILEQSRRNNPPRGITGILCFSDNLFLQVIEGGRAAISTLFNTIASDHRHSGMQILLYEEIAERSFASWSMGQVNLAKVNPSLLLKYSEQAKLDPFTCSGKASMALLHELIATAAVVTRGDALGVAYDEGR